MRPRWLGSSMVEVELIRVWLVWIVIRLAMAITQRGDPRPRYGESVQDNRTQRNSGCVH